MEKAWCIFIGSCSLLGDICEGGPYSKCASFEKIATARSERCEAGFSEKCAYPKYRALVREGTSCGVEGNCFVLEILQDGMCHGRHGDYSLEDFLMHASHLRDCRKVLRAHGL
ncbi:MAG TPA: hypothetical protein DCX32_01505 [Candidatus Moranbacteria bacterium]|nr:hypothetical protein [Candidatus Moranbacteria bacterium]